MRAVLETLGVQDVVGKSTGSSNPYNMIRATFEALKVQSSPRQVAAKRGKKVADLMGRRDDGASAPEAAPDQGLTMAKTEAKHRHRPPDRQPDPPQERTSAPPWRAWV